MTLTLYDTATRTPRPLETMTPGVVKIYACGPTIYDRAHIGNFRSFLAYDAVVRVLTAQGLTVRFVSNLTDVDDKTIRGAARAGLSLAEFTGPFGDAFKADCAALGLIPPTDAPCATAYLGEMITLIGTLLERGAAYRTEDGSVYFSIQSFPAYGALAGLDLSTLRPGARVTVDEHKDAAADFALWKAAKPEDEAVGAAWDAPWGRGRPGWHIECSAMAMGLLGPTVDLHLGGEDLKFPHHEAEIAQSESATRQPFVRHWMHVKHLLVDGGKMSKSMGNFYTLADLLALGHRPSGIRHLLLSAHYRSELNFTLESLQGAQAAVDRLADFADRLDGPATGAIALGLEPLAHETRRAFWSALDDDLNLSAAWSAVYDFVSSANALLDRGAPGAGERATARGLVSEIDQVMGTLALARAERALSPETQEWVTAQLAERTAAKAARDWGRADAIRDAIAERGLLVEDGPTGPRVRRR